MAFLALEPRRSAATRAHVVRPAQLLVERGARVTVFEPPDGSAFMSMSGHHSAVKAGYWAARVLPRALAQVARARRADVVVVQRAVFRYDAPPVLERWLARPRADGSRPSLVLSLDDALYLVRRRAYDRRIDLADLVATGNEDIAAYARGRGANVLTYPGSIEVGRYPTTRPARSRLVLGWTGTLPHRDLEPLDPVLRALCAQRDDFDVRIVSRHPYALPTVPAHRQAWSAWRPAEEHSMFREFDVGLMPLQDAAYDRGKEAYKLKEYMASGLPVVASRVGHNMKVVADGQDGLLAAGQEEWLVRLTRLLDEPSLRERLGAAARRRAEAEFDVGALVPYVDELLRLARR